MEIALDICQFSLGCGAWMHMSGACRRDLHPDGLCETSRVSAALDCVCPRPTTSMAIAMVRPRYGRPVDGQAAERRSPGRARDA
jgi:hypothetical protein